MSTSEKSTGSWLSAAVGRLFSGSKTDDGKESGQPPNVGSSSQKSLDAKKLLKDIAPVNGVTLSLPNSSPRDSTSGSKNLRYLSPSAIDSNSSNISLKSTATNYRFNPSGTVSRKRQLIDGQQNLTNDGLLFRDNIKRFRGSNGHSMIEEPSRSLFSDRLDMSWAGGLPSFADGSPASSNRSLISRVSGAASTTSSGLSSKTRAILNQLERISTPAREARKLPMMRGTNFPPERWAPMQSGITTGVLSSPSLAPPLRRTANAVPSRIQLLSTSMAAQRKPYWRDIARKTRNEEQEQNSVDSSKVNGTKNSNGNKLHPIFDMGSSSEPVQTLESNAISSTQTKTKTHQAVIKGSDGKATSRNVFNTKDLENEDSEVPPTAYLTSVNTLGKIAPAEGFMNDIIFSFAPPIERIPGASVENSIQSSDEDSDKSDESENEKTDDEDEVSGSGGSGVEGVSTAVKPGDEKKESRPPTAADSETSAASASTTATPISSKNVSPLIQATKEEKSWDCPDCCITNKPDASSCAACGYSKEGNSKTLQSNLSTFAKSTGGVSFGFSGATNHTGDSIKSSGFEITSSLPEKPSTRLDIIKNETPKTVQLQSLTAISDKKEEKREVWNCPDCFISNEGANDKCQCCGHVKYGAKNEDAKSTSAFGNRAFKPTTTSTTGVAFGFGTSAKPNIGSGISFGLNSTSSILPQNTITNPVSTFGLNSKSSDEKSSSGEVVKPVFGVEAPISKVVERKVEPTASVFSISSGASVFGSSAKPPLFELAKEKQENNPALSLFNSSSPAPLLNSNSTVTTANSVSLTQSSDTVTTSVSSASGTKLLFGTSVPVRSAPAPIFGALSSNEPSQKVPLFGQSSNSVVSTVSATPSSDSNFCPSSSSSSVGVFFSNTSEGNANSVGAVQVPTGSGFRPSTTNTGTGLFASTKPAFSIGGDKQAGSELFGSSTESTKSGIFGTATTTSSIFGSTTTDVTVKPSLFGNNSAPAPSVQTSTASLPFQFGSSTSSSSLFGGSNSSPAFGLFTSSAAAPSVTPALSNSSSTNSLFSANSADSTKPFVFGSTVAAPSGSSFQFGSSTSAVGGAAPFVFGAQSQPSATAAPAFGGFAAPTSSTPAVFNFNTEPVAPAPGGAFAFNATTSQRKVVSARRRLPPNRR